MPLRSTIIFLIWATSNTTVPGINVGTRSHYGTRLSHNWVHDCNRQGIRFDYHGTNVLREDGEVYGDGVIYEQRNLEYPAQSGKRRSPFDPQQYHC